MLFPVHTRVEQITMGIGGVNWRWSHKIRISFCVAASKNSRHEHPPELPWTQMTYKGNASDKVQLDYSNPSGETFSNGKLSVYNHTQLQFLPSAYRRNEEGTVFTGVFLFTFRGGGGLPQSGRRGGEGGYPSS